MRSPFGFIVLVAALTPTAARAELGLVRKVSSKVATARKLSASWLRASQALGRPLCLQQARGVLAAHEVGLGENGRDGRPAGVGNYTVAQLLRKARILERHGVTRAGERRTLFAKGIVGRPRGDYVSPAMKWWAIANEAKSIDELKAQAAAFEKDHGVKIGLTITPYQRYVGREVFWRLDDGRPTRVANQFFEDGDRKRPHERNGGWGGP